MAFTVQPTTPTHMSSSPKWATLCELALLCQIVLSIPFAESETLSSPACTCSSRPREGRAMVQGTGTQYLWRPLRGGQNDEDDGEYERERREKLKKNQEMLAQFGIVDLKNEMAAMKKVKHVRRRPRDQASKNLEPVRRSSRMTKTQVRYAESSEEEKARRNDDSSVEMSSGMDEDSEVVGAASSEVEYEAELDVDNDVTVTRSRKGKKSRARRSKNRTNDFVCPSWAPRDKVTDLFEELRATRLQLSRLHRIPSYKVANDRSLWEMAISLPRNTDQLQQCWGMGARKAATFGEQLLYTLKKYRGACWAPSSGASYWNDQRARPQGFVQGRLPQTFQRPVAFVQPARPPVPVGSLFINGSWVHPTPRSSPAPGGTPSNPHTGG